jgi:hypothetical protein
MLARTSLRGAPLGPSSGKGFLPTWKVKKKKKKRNINLVVVRGLRSYGTMTMTMIISYLFYYIYRLSLLVAHRLNTTDQEIFEGRDMA